MKTPPTLYDQCKDFSRKLPAEYLFRTGPDRYGYYHEGKDLFGFLSEVDETSGRVQRKQDGRAEEFHYIRFHMPQFIELVRKHSKGVRSFIDVGCGAGDKLACVKRLYPKIRVTGVEHDPAMACWASTVADEVFCCDAMKLDYGRYDLIYAYWPISNRDLMDKLIVHILDTKLDRAKFILVGYQDYALKIKHPKAGKIIIS